MIRTNPTLSAQQSQSYNWWLLSYICDDEWFVIGRFHNYQDIHDAAVKLERQAPNVELAIAHRFPARKQAVN